MRKKYTKQLSRMEATRLQLMSELCKWSKEQFHLLPEDGAWNTAQVIDHLADAEKGTVAYMQKKIEYCIIAKQMGKITSHEI